ncbi:type II toxin-antitoxin system RelE/ParE family toxin [Levilactobacillus angrenensis]|uniref:type II toxin-antitoxin system RelE/ParE family toxin n=1 Tax=Levilactobacillus angrenensis TaxID=2486020 RepID=UPI0021F070B8|nr:type II toxin-antitoxin system RelE/ParE family toxin [Levilactobacillus angrenensis]
MQEFGMIVSRKQKWVRKLEHNLFEIRSRQANNIQRVIYFHLKDNQYVITHGFTKKTQKAPSKRNSTRTPSPYTLYNEKEWPP